jgi:hypothetical protein
VAPTFIVESEAQRVGELVGQLDADPERDGSGLRDGE